MKMQVIKMMKEYVLSHTNAENMMHTSLNKTMDIWLKHYLLWNLIANYIQNRKYMPHNPKQLNSFHNSSTQYLQSTKVDNYMMQSQAEEKKHWRYISL